MHPTIIPSVMLNAWSWRRRRSNCVEPDRPKEIHGLTAEDIARMERETEILGRDFKIIEESHGRNVLNLVVVAGFLRKMLNNARAVRFLSQNYREILSEFQKLAELKNLGDEAIDR